MFDLKKLVGQPMLKKLREKASGTSAIISRAFEKAVAKTGAVVDSETANKLKASALNAAKTAASIGKNLSDLNGDGKVDVEDLKLAAEKAGIAWNKIDPDLKTALVAGGAAGVGVNFIPLIGQLIAVPTFVATTAYFFLVAKLTKIKAGPQPTPTTPTPDVTMPEVTASKPSGSDEA